MGQTLKKLAPGSEEKKVKEIGPIIDTCYDSLFKEAYQRKKSGGNDADGSQIPFGEFHYAVCRTVEQINQKFGNTQFRSPKVQELEDAWKKHHQERGNQELKKEEFQKILKEVITASGFTGVGGAKEALLYIFGVPVVTLFIKQRAMPRAIRDEFFIPGVTSLTVLVLAGLNKI